jgi:hypothetical protein
MLALSRVETFFLMSPDHYAILSRCSSVIGLSCDVFVAILNLGAQTSVSNSVSDSCS